MITTPKILTVSQLNFYLKSLLDNDPKLRFVFLEGEISNLTDHYSSGHIYFSLKDEKSVVKAVMFSFAAKNLKFKPKNGMKVLVRGRVAVYEPSGQYQLYVEDMQPDGVGALSLQFEQLKEKLSKEGLFDASHKKPLPLFPQTVGVITSPTGAAVRDILNILSRRYPCADVVLSPVLVQGENAAQQMVNAVDRFSATRCADVIIIGRGGGSMEDLWAFNDEELAKAIYRCEIPVVSAVGHETDFTICDFVSDLRAPTPSAAAELVVPDRTELSFNLSAQNQYISALLDKKLNDSKRNIDNYSKLLSAYSPKKKIDNYEKTLNEQKSKLKLLATSIVDKKLSELKTLSSKLSSLNPIDVLMRGYSYTTDKDDTPVISVKDITIGEKINIKIHDGVLSATVDEIKED